MADFPWEQSYADPSTRTFGGPSAEVIDVAARMPRDATVLDIGCGEGRNALFLAKRGFDVTAVDMSGSAIRKLRALAKNEGIDIRTEVADMCTYPLDSMFDLIMSHGCLHLVERAQWQDLVARFKSHTAPGGVNIVVVFTDALPPPADLAEHCVGLFKEGELFSLYSDWTIELQRSYIREDEHPGSPRHVHPINKVVARRPTNQGMHVAAAGAPASGS